MNKEKKIVKVAVTGPHCSGKSTLLSRIEEDIKSQKIKVTKFDGSICPINYSEKATINDENEEMSITLWMLSKMLLREIETKYTTNYENDIIIFDRCLFDQIVYPLVNFKDHNNDRMDIIKKIINLWLNNNPYDIIFYVPQNQEFLKEVPEFNQDLEYLENVEKTYLRVLDNLQPKCKVIILPKNQDEQKQIIISIISRLL
ncbi:hypothetical protein D0T84_16090 [Dysgonomonas sp. 521]|uniref:AAA family ATPase n=1 Tax=Dysgonomonas sp. 521 TaxID=2302932 RepID=UPI0013D6768F|nr:AAA family ATPase [Dysgonomonas sp. 521]NDV96422.1 hypothetical protein [Dysgonomonas sp. 521]